MGAFGTSTAAIAATGSPTPAAVESWNGSSWTEIAEVNTGRSNVGAAGSTPQTSGIIFGGSVSPKGQTEIWNGSTWTEVSDLNTAGILAGGSGSSSLNALAFGRNVPPRTVNTEIWNGSSWTEVANLGTARYSGGSAGSSSASAIFAGGVSSTFNPSATEEWTADIANKTITTS